jgi:hypothetical protein
VLPKLAAQPCLVRRQAAPHRHQRIRNGTSGPSGAKDRTSPSLRRTTSYTVLSVGRTYRVLLNCWTYPPAHQPDQTAKPAGRTLESARPCAARTKFAGATGSTDTAPFLVRSPTHSGRTPP